MVGFLYDVQQELFMRREVNIMIIIYSRDTFFSHWNQYIVNWTLKIFKVALLDLLKRNWFSHVQNTCEKNLPKKDF